MAGVLVHVHVDVDVYVSSTADKTDLGSKARPV